MSSRTCACCRSKPTTMPDRRCGVGRERGDAQARAPGSASIAGDACASTERDACASTCPEDVSLVSFESSRADRAVTAAFWARGFFLVRSCGLVGRGKALLRGLSVPMPSTCEAARGDRGAARSANDLHRILRPPRSASPRKDCWASCQSGAQFELGRLLYTRASAPRPPRGALLSGARLDRCPARPSSPPVGPSPLARGCLRCVRRTSTRSRDEDLRTSSAGWTPGPGG